MPVLRVTMAVLAAVLATLVVMQAPDQVSAECRYECEHRGDGCYDGCAGLCHSDCIFEYSGGGNFNTEGQCNEDMCDKKGPDDPSCCDAMSRDMYTKFFIACLVLVFLLECGGWFYLGSNDIDLGWRNVLLLLVVGIRSFDMMSDWAFFAISLRPDSGFAYAYEDHATVRICSGVFASLGLLMWIPDIWGYYYRASPDSYKEDERFAAKMTACVVLLEDAPQLCINIVYLNTMGFAGADPIAIFSFVMSILSLIFNIGLGISEARDIAKGDM